MAKTIYTATDPNGVEHKRSTESRAYTHTVVYRDNYERELAACSHKNWPQQDRRNWEYYVAIANGRDPYPEKMWLQPGASEEVRAAEAERVAARNAKRVADAKAKIGEPDQGLGAYLNRQLAERIASVEAKKEAGGFDVYRNAGWCGRYDLAQNLVAQMSRGGKLDIMILAAVEKVKAHA